MDGIHAFGAKVRLHICGNTRKIVEGMGGLGCDIVDLDSLTSLADARQKMSAGQVLLGNLKPVTELMDGSPESVTAGIAECHRPAGARFIVGAGCEVPRDTPPENLRALGEYARTHAPTP